MRFALYLALAACIANAQPPRYNAEKEAALGQALTQDLLRRTPAVESPAARDYIERLGARITAQLPSQAQFRYTIIAAESIPEPTIYPGGYVFVPVQLIITAR